MSTESSQVAPTRQGTAGNVIAALCNVFVPGLGHLVQGRILGALFFFVTTPEVHALHANRSIENAPVPTLIAAASSDRDRPAALALWGTFFTVGLSLAAIAGGWLSEDLGWRGWFRRRHPDRRWHGQHHRHDRVGQ